MKKSSNGSRVSSLVERLLFSAMVKQEVASDLKYYQKIFRMKNSLFFYRELMESEAGHYTTFIMLENMA
jgi:tRNA-(ms[2]io[6]A)-hydroxylase